jgi:hypothetical protein
MKIEFEYFDSHLVYTKLVGVKIEDDEVDCGDGDYYYAKVEVPLKTPKMFVRCVIWLSEVEEVFIVGAIYIDDQTQKWSCAQIGNKVKLISIDDQKDGFKLPTKFVLLGHAFRES